MPSSDTLKASASARTLTLAAYVSFVPIGVATVLLGPMLPILSARWSLNYSQAGRLFPVQYVSSTVAVALSGWLVSRWGFRFAIKAGLLLMTAGLVLMMAGPKLLALICIAAYGGGLGLSVPAANLMVAELNPDRRSATLNWLNFCWSAGAVSCPFLVAVAAKNHHEPLLLASVSACSLLLALGFALLPGHFAESAKSSNAGPKIIPVIRGGLHPFLLLAALFFIYVGTENGFGGWVASYARSLGNLTPAMALMTPSFFYAALTFGRWLAPFLLHIDEIKLVRAGLLLGCAGSAGLIFSHGLAGVVTSACAAGLGLSYVYPITISLLSREFGAASSKIGSVMFVLSNIGGGLFPWIVGISSNRFGTLKAGLFVPLLGCAAMFALYLGNYWDRSRMAD
jgi:MFS transporter, FHS family, glucose/mannose:H+ symporter